MNIRNLTALDLSLRILTFVFFRNMDESLRGTVGKLLVGTEARVCALLRQVLKFGACDVQ